MGPTWVLSAPDGPHVGPMNLAIRGIYLTTRGNDSLLRTCQQCYITNASQRGYKGCNWQHQWVRSTCVQSVHLTRSPGLSKILFGLVFFAHLRVACLATEKVATLLLLLRIATNGAASILRHDSIRRLLADGSARFIDTALQLADWIITASQRYGDTAPWPPKNAL